MEIRIKNKRIEVELSHERERSKHLGESMAKNLRLRVASLEAAESLAVFWPPFSLSERCHEPKEKRRGTFSIDLKQPYRLLFVPVEEEQLPNRHDEQNRWSTITIIELIGIEDTHG